MRPSWRKRRRGGNRCTDDQRGKAVALTHGIAECLGIEADYVMPAYEDPAYWLVKEGDCRSTSIRSIRRSRIPKSARAWCARFDAGCRSRPASCCRCSAGTRRRAVARPALGQRAMAAAARQAVPDAGRFAGRLPPAARLAALGAAVRLSLHSFAGPAGTARRSAGRADAEAARRAFRTLGGATERAPGPSSSRTIIEGAVRTALSVEPRDGVLCVFMPPVEKLEDYLELARRGRGRRRGDPDCRCTSRAIRRPTIRASSRSR